MYVYVCIYIYMHVNVYIYIYGIFLGCMHDMWHYSANRGQFQIMSKNCQFGVNTLVHILHNVGNFHN
jgi:hypothetical protein